MPAQMMKMRYNKPFVSFWHVAGTMLTDWTNTLSTGKTLATGFKLGSMLSVEMFQEFPNLIASIPVSLCYPSLPAPVSNFWEVCEGGRYWVRARRFKDFSPFSLVPWKQSSLPLLWGFGKTAQQREKQFAKHCWKTGFGISMHFTFNSLHGEKKAQCPHTQQAPIIKSME